MAVRGLFKTGIFTTKTFSRSTGNSEPSSLQRGKNDLSILPGDVAVPLAAKLTAKNRLSMCKTLIYLGARIYCVNYENYDIYLETGIFSGRKNPWLNP